VLRQGLLSLFVLGAGFVLWAMFAPGAQQTLASYGIEIPFITTEASASTGSQPPAGRPGGAPGGAPGGGPGAGSGGPGAGGGPGGFAARANNVVTTPVTLSRINDGIMALGEGVAINAVTVVSQASGTLNEILVSPGEVVEAGQVIARLDSENEDIALEQAQLALQDAEANLSRQRELAGSNLVAASALNAAQLAADTAALALRSAEVAQARRSIVSPIAGTVGLLQVNPGSFLAAQTAVTTVNDTSQIAVDFWLPERFSTAVAPGDEVSVTAVALPGQTFSGVVTSLDNRIDPASRTLQVRALIPNDENRLRAGMSFSVAITFPGETYATVNPLAILWSAEGSYVWRYNDGTAERVLAEIIQRNSDGVLVQGELAEGDPIITEGILKLSEGAPVTLLSGPDGSDSATAETAAPTPATASN
jgi:RND family efflux transporter MFP subunit